MSYANGPRIVTSGLVLYLDAGNSKSYPGTGTAWNDLSGNGNNGTLTNGPTYSSSNKGSIVFDGTNDYVQINSSSSLDVTNAATIIVTVKVNGFAANRARLIDTNGSSLPDNIGGNLALKIGTSSPFQEVSFYILSGTTAYEVKRTNSIITSTTIPYVISARWRGSDGASSIFVNSTEASYSTTTTYTGTCGPLTNPIMIGFLQRYNIYGNQTIYNTLIYNKYLTNSEILQNYNAIKGRFGL